jgi:hypothetical protein
MRAWLPIIPLMGMPMMELATGMMDSENTMNQYNLLMETLFSIIDEQQSLQKEMLNSRK